MTSQTSATHELKEQLKELVTKYVYKKFDKPIQLSSGSKTTEYFDGKQITLFPDRAIIFARFVLSVCDLTKIDAVGGMSVGADPIVTAVSLAAFLEKKVNIPAFFVRKEAKGHGLQKQIEGIELKKGMRVLIVEDVVTKGNATLNAIKAVESTGAEVAQVVCLLDREAGGSTVLSAKYPFTAALTRSQII
jgi:orotate phosphoribosyltransferase